MEENKVSNNNWSIQSIWNEELTIGRDEREPFPRNYIWASELGKNLYERYLKMNAIPPDFDYEERVLRKFEAGNFFERIIGFVLMSSGLLKFDNKPYRIPADEDHLEISVRPDFIAGGKPDWDRVRQDIKTNLLFDLMPNLARISKRLVETLSEKYPDGLKDLLYEIKSVNSTVFWSKKDYLSEAYPHHQLQCFAGMKARKLPEGRLLYISKDDLTVAEFILKDDNPSLNKRYDEDVKAITKYIRGKEEPPKPKSIVFDPQKKLRFQYLKKQHCINGCFTENWEVNWSNYISRMTGIQGKTQGEVAGKWKNIITKEIREKNEELKTEFKGNLK